MFQILIPILLGFASVLQGGLNGKFMNEVGLPKAVVINNLVLFLASVVLFLMRPAAATEPAGFPDLKSLPLYILPGLLGLTLVAGIPWALSKWGASFFFISLIASQTIFSLVWDFLVSGIVVDTYRLVGLSLGMASLVVTMGAKT